LVAVLGLFAIAGCNGPEPDPNAFNPPPRKKLPDLPPAAAEAGLKVDPSDPGLMAQAQTMAFTTRANPFALLPTEIRFDKSQLAASLNETMGFYPLFGESEPQPVQPPFRYVEEPDRRLAGVMIGETVSALIDMNDGSPMQIIRPGSTIKNASGQDTWIVESVDEERALLRRIEPNVRPTHIVVRLQNSPGGGTSGGAGGGAGAGGGRQGGAGGGRQGGAGDPRGGGGNAGPPRGGRRDD
jgi:hypothetical protein